MGFFPLISALSGSGGSEPPPASNVKNVQSIARGSDLVSASQDYGGFGFGIYNEELNRVTTFFRYGTGHLTGGKNYYQHYDVETDEFEYPEVLVIDGTPTNMQDVAGGLMDNGEIICFGCKTANNIGGGDWSTVNQFVKLDKDTMAVTQTLTDYIGGTSGVTQIQRSWAFGSLTYLGTPGSYAIGVLRRQITGTPYSSIGILKTTDYFETFTHHQITDTYAGYSEVTVEYLGSSRMIALMRDDQGGPWYVYYSSNTGSTWAAGGSSGLGHWNAQVKIMHSIMHDGLMNLIFQCRDSGMILLSKNNDPDVFFGNVTNFQPPQIVSWNYHPNSFYNGLGYPWMVPIVTTGVTNPIWYIEWCRETQWVSDGGSGGSAERRYCRWDLITAPSGVVPAAPTLIQSYVDASGINITIGHPYSVPTGYAYSDFDSIDYWLFDVSTNSGFSSFVTAKWRNDIGNESLQNKRLVGFPLILRNLTAATTYYIRIKAVNNFGESAYSTINVTTSSS